MDSNNMDLDSSPEPKPLKPRDRVLRRLAQLGLPKEYLEMLYPGIVAFVMNDRLWIPELVSTILPADGEVAEALYAYDTKSKETNNPTMKKRFRECMIWLQWLMFLGEPAVALENLSKLSAARGVCGAVWGNDDIAYQCRTCEKDYTCAICVPCFQNGNHMDHDYSVIYTVRGCCDCGDVTAWKQEGFCSKHKGAEQIQPLSEEFANSVGPVLEVLFTCWKNKLISAETFHQKNLRARDRVAVSKKAANELTFVVVEMLIEFCRYSESLLSFVSRKVMSLAGLLELLVRAERFLGEVVTKKLHELLLKLLGDPIFKYAFAKVFLTYYPVVVNEAIKEGRDTAFKKYPLLSTFSVQIFTVPTLTSRLVKEMNLLDTLLECLLDIFIHVAGEDGRLELTKWGNLNGATTRVVQDIQFVMSHGTVPKYITHDQRGVLITWMKLLSFLQGVKPLKRETDIHVEEEEEEELMNIPFVFSHSVGIIHSLLVDGAFPMSEDTDGGIFSDLCRQNRDEGNSVRHAKVIRLSQETSVCSMKGRDTAFVSATKVAEAKSDSNSHLLIPSSLTWLTCECLRTMENCMGADDMFASSTSISNVSNSNLLALKKRFSNNRKGKYNFARTDSSEDSRSQYFSPAYVSYMSDDIENTESMVTVETDSGDFEGNSIEGESCTELDAQCVLNLSDWPDINYDVSSQDVSIHIPLHRFLSLLLQKALRRCCGESGVLNMMNASTSLFATNDFFGCVLGGCHPYGFSAFVMEHPLRNRVFCAEVRAGMWRKNGDAAILSCEWYHSVSWSEQGLELDLFLLQCCAALAPADLFVSRIVERFGLSDYLSLNSERSSEYESVLVQEMLTLILQIVQERRFSGLTPAENLKRELVHKLSIGDATHSRLVKSLPCDLSKFHQLQEILDTVAVYSNPSGFNQGMYSLRGMYWKELDLYHPRLNSRDLQIVEERYMRQCSVSALITQLPRWTKIYFPLMGVARIATCKAVLQIVRAVLFYAVFTNNLSETRAPDGILLTALHLLSLALDICFQLRESMDVSCGIGDSAPMLTFAGEEIHEGLNYGAGEESLLSLLVSLMRMHKRENLDNFLDAGSCNLSLLIGSLLKKFAEIDSECMTKLLQLAPEVVIRKSQSIPNTDTNTLSTASDVEKRKAKARERQAAIMAKMRAEQSKFLSNINCASAHDLKLKSELEQSNLNDRQIMEESTQEVCSLCHDPNSKSPVSFMILLQKSMLLSFVHKGIPSWDQVQWSDKEQVLVTTNKLADQSRLNSTSSGSDFFKAQIPSPRNIQVASFSKNVNYGTLHTFEMLEQDMYLSIRKEMCDNMLVSNSTLEDSSFSASKDDLKGRRSRESVLQGKYIAALSREETENLSPSEDAQNDEANTEYTSQHFAYDGFGPADCNGVHLSSCGHAVHQECLDRYLSSLKERHLRRIAFEGGQVVNPYQGEFLCPVCRQLANSVLPSLPGNFQKVWKQPMISTGSSSHATGPVSPSTDESKSLCLQQALSLLQSAANVVEKGDILESLSVQGNERIRLNLDSISRLLFKLYFPNSHDKFSGSLRVNHSMIMWDTLKYSLSSMEIAARCGRTSMNPNYGLNALYKELKSSSGFALSILVKIVQVLRSKNSVHALQRFRGIQLFADSVCSGVSMDYSSSTFGSGGNMSCMLKHIEKEVPYPDMQFWNRAAEPVLAHDAFSSLMWVLFCLPRPFLLCKESLFSFMHIFYVVSVAQAIIMYVGKHRCKNIKVDFHDCLIADISKIVGKSRWIQQYFVSNYTTPSADIRDFIRRMSFPYLRRCALLWKLLNTSISEPFCGRDHVLNVSSHAIDDITGTMDGDLVELNEVYELEKMFKIPPLDVVLKDHVPRSLVIKWLHHFCKEYEVSSFHCVLDSTPMVPFKLMHLPHIYQDLLQRYLKQLCASCNNILDDPALCLLCGRLCSSGWKPCCRESSCQNHAMACGAGTGVFLLIRRTTILLQRCARQAPWPSPYLDAFGEEDIDMMRGKPLYVNEERYAALTYMVASHGLDRNSKVLGQTTIGFSV